MKFPKIRFKDNTSEWQTSRLNEWLLPSRKKNVNLLYDKNDVLSVSGEFGVVNQIKFHGKSFAGASVKNYGVVDKGNIVYTKSPLRKQPYGIIKSNKGQAGIVSTLYAIYNSVDTIYPDFIEEYFNNDKRLNDYLRPLVRKGAKNDMKVSSDGALEGLVTFPEKDEQIQITEFLAKMSKLIISLKNKNECLIKLKQSMLLMMFPQEGESLPKVRFKGFNEEWKYVQLGDLFKERNESNINGEMLSVTMSQGIIKASENGRFDNSNSDKSKYKVVCIDDIAYNSMRMWQGASGCSKYNGIVSPAYTVLIPEKNVDSLFFSYLFKTDSSLKLFKLNSQGLTSDNWNLKYQTLSKIKVFYPTNISEQQQIAAYFVNIDQQISLQTQRLEKLKQIKSACLDKMFV